MAAGKWEHRDETVAMGWISPEQRGADAQILPPAQIQLPLCPSRELLVGKRLPTLQKVTAGQAADSLDKGQGQVVPLVAGAHQHRACRGSLRHGTNLVLSIHCCRTCPLLALLLPPSVQDGFGKWESLKNPFPPVTSSNSSFPLALSSRKDAVTAQPMQHPQLLTAEPRIKPRLCTAPNPTCSSHCLLKCPCQDPELPPLIWSCSLCFSSTAWTCLPATDSQH